MSDFPVTSDVFQNYLDGLRDWAATHLHPKFEDDILNAIHCKCVKWTVCDHASEFCRRLDKAQRSYEEELMFMMRYVNRVIVDNAMYHCDTDEKFDSEIRSFMKYKSDEVRTFKWVKRNMTPWELSQLSIRICNKPKPDDGCKMWYLTILDEMARSHDWKDKVKPF